MGFLFGKSGKAEYIIAGLGNPGAEYERTRHNTGFCALDFISGKSGIEVKRLKHYALTGKGEIDGKSVLLMKPQTFMNDSGKAIADAARFYKIPPEKIIIIFDDISLDVAKMRIKRNGSDGGHNGIKSIIACLGSNNFPRIKIGVGAKPNPEYDLADWVLGKFSPSDAGAIKDKCECVYEAVKLIMNGETEKAMQLYN